MTCALAGGLCAVSGMLPNLDSGLGIPLRESVAFAAAVVPMMMIQRFHQMGLPIEGVILVGRRDLSYDPIWNGLAPQNVCHPPGHVSQFTRNVHRWSGRFFSVCSGGSAPPIFHRQLPRCSASSRILCWTKYGV